MDTKNDILVGCIMGSFSHMKFVLILKSKKIKDYCVKVGQKG